MHYISPTNSVQKVCRILRALSIPQPLQLADLSGEAGLNKTTALRLHAQRGGAWAPSHGRFEGSAPSCSAELAAGRRVHQ